jgi:hypothetical protein
VAEANPQEANPQEANPQEAISDETSEIIRRHEEAMAKAGRKTTNRTRPDIMENVDTAMHMQNPDDNK